MAFRLIVGRRRRPCLGLGLRLRLGFRLRFRLRLRLIPVLLLFFLFLVIIRQSFEGPFQIVPVVTSGGRRAWGGEFDDIIEAWLAPTVKSWIELALREIEMNTRGPRVPALSSWVFRFNFICYLLLRSFGGSLGGGAGGGWGHTSTKVHRVTHSPGVLWVGAADPGQRGAAELPTRLPLDDLHLSTNRAGSCCRARVTGSLL